MVEYSPTGRGGRVFMAKFQLTCADIFAGAGGFSLAAENEGLSVRLAIENDAHAVATYKANFRTGSDGHLLLAEDIREIDFAVAKRRAFPNGMRCDLILGGPPCQGYSRHRINDAGVGDDRNDLIHSYFDCVKELQPTAFLMENVPGMLWQRHSAYVREFYRRGRAAGYRIFDPVILDARDYGVPQRRKRVFILGFQREVELSDLTWPPKPTHGPVARDGTEEWIDCRDAFRPAPVDDPNDMHMSHGKELIAAFKNTPANGGGRHQSGRVLKCHVGHDGHKDVYGRIDPSKPAPTMTTACINPSKGRFVHPTLHHGITVRQAARIQTFPDTFVFSGGLMAAGRQVGNAVPVRLAEVILNGLQPALSAAAQTRKSAKSKRPQRA